MVSLTFAFPVPQYTRSEWTIERHNFEAQYGESLEAVDDDLVAIQKRLDDLCDAVVRWTLYVVARLSLRGPHHDIPSLLGRRCS
jgi:hypothetical protein